MGEVIYLDSYRQKIVEDEKKTLEEEEKRVQELKDLLEKLIIENNIRYCEDPPIMWYNINDGEYHGDQETGYYCAIDPRYFLDYDYDPSDH